MTCGAPSTNFNLPFLYSSISTTFFLYSIGVTVFQYPPETLLEHSIHLINDYMSFTTKEDITGITMFHKSTGSGN
jgi:hypothetical protein